MKGNIFNLFLIWAICFLCSCATTSTSPLEEELFSEDELDFLAEEEEFFEDELKGTKTQISEKTSDDDFMDEEEEFFADDDEEEVAPSFANKEEQEEQEAENELKEIEDEFAEFISEEETPEVVAEEESAEEEFFEEETPEVVAEEEFFEEETPEVVAEEESTEEEFLKEETPEESAEGDSLIADNQSDTKASGDLIQVNNIRYENQQIFIDTIGGTPSYRSRFNEATKQFIIELPQSVIMDKLKWPYIMKDFQSGFALLQADQKEPQVVRIIVQMRSQEKAPLLMEKEDGLIVSASTVDLTKDQGVFVADEEESGSSEPSLSVDNDYADLDQLQESEQQVLHAQTIEEFLLGDHKFYGHPITLDVRDTSLKDILHFLVEDSGINMIISNTIPDKKINIRLQEVPWDQALVLIMKKNKLGYVREGSVVTISSLDEIKDHQKELQELITARENLIPLQLEIIPLAYAKAGSISNLVGLFKTPRGKINIDNDNNSLIIHETAYALEDMRKLIKRLDRTPKQVMISAKIVEATESFTRNFGVSWRLSGETFNPLVAIGALSQIEVTPAPLLSALPGTPDQGTLGTNLTVGNLGPGLGDLDVALGFAESDGQARVISSPRIMALNGQSASVSQTTESIAFSAVATESGTQTAIQRSPINLTLSVLPQITNVNSIYMQVSMNRGSEGSPISNGQGSTARPTSTRTASTNILVKSGHTAVIGGIYETRNADSLQGIPFLKDIPLLSWLFSQVRDETSRTELLLFLTPRIIDINQEKMNVASEGNG